MIEFTKQEERLSLREAEYWKKVFMSNLMIGTEVEIMFSSDSIQTSDVSSMVRDLKPGSSPAKFKSCIEHVTGDGSLSNGAEIVTPGRRVYGFLEQFSMYQNIYNAIKDDEPVINPRMGWHNHLVLQKYDGVDCMETPMPRIIFDNFMMLCKKYYPALAYISSTMPNEDAYTRYNNFCRHDKLMNLDLDYDLYDIKDHFDDRYNCVNINNLGVGDETISCFHIELRFPDGTLIPIQMASLNVLFKALTIKAVNLSKIGVMDIKYMNEKLYDFKNNGSRRASSIEHCATRPDSTTRLSGMLTEDYMDKIKEMTVELIELLSPEICSIDANALYFLKKLAVKPVSVMFRENNTKDLRVVNDMLEEELDVLIEKEDVSVLPLVEIIESGAVRNVESLEEWMDKVNNLVSYKEPLDDVINKISKTNKVRFNKALGFYFE